MEDLSIHTGLREKGCRTWAIATLKGTSLRKFAAKRS